MNTNFLNNETSAEKLVASAREMESKGMTFIKFCDVDKFLLVCEIIGLVACGGAFATDMSGQWFYV
jgi:hypothetical protein